MLVLFFSPSPGACAPKASLSFSGLCPPHASGHSQGSPLIPHWAVSQGLLGQEVSSMFIVKLPLGYAQGQGEKETPGGAESTHARVLQVSQVADSHSWRVRNVPRAGEGEEAREVQDNKGDISCRAWHAPLFPTWHCLRRGRVERGRGWGTGRREPYPQSQRILPKPIMEALRP